jgi:acyl carrier protein
MADLRYELRSYIIENYLFGRGDDLKDTDSFWELGLMDSTGVLELISYLEEKYSVCLESGEIVPENLDSIEKLTMFMSRKLEQMAASRQEKEHITCVQGVRR